MTKMKLSKDGLFALALHEGIVPAPYLDGVGVLTYGIGHTAAAGEVDPKDIPEGMPKDLDEAIATVVKLFVKTVKRYEDEVNAAITVPVEQHEFDAAVSFHYNTGAISRAAWVKFLNEKPNNREAAAKKILNWSKPAMIKKRRAAEHTLFLTGTYPSGTIPVWTVQGNQVTWQRAAQVSREEFIEIVNPPKPSLLTTIINLIINLMRDKNA